MNLLRKGIADYLEPRRGLGFKLVIDERHLRAFIAVLETKPGNWRKYPARPSETHKPA